PPLECLRDAMAVPRAAKACELRRAGPPRKEACMATHTLHPTERAVGRPALSRWLLVGFLGGAAAVIVFHQGAWALIHALGLTPRAPYSLAATQPLGVPVLASLAFWGGVW